MKKKGISLLLVILMVTALLPSEALLVVAESTYTVLCEPNIEGGVRDTYGNAAIVGSDVYCLVEYNGSGVKTITENYRGLSDFTDAGLSIASKVVNDEWQYGVIDSHGQTTIAFQSHSIWSCSNDGYAHTNDDNGGRLLLNINTKEKITAPEGIGIFNNGRACASTWISDNGHEHNEYYYFDITGNRVLEGYASATDFQNGYACVEMLGEEYPRIQHIIDTNGNTQFTTEGKSYRIGFSGVSKEGLLAVYDSESNQYGYVDLTGEIVIPCQYAYGLQFKNGYAVVNSTGGGTGLIDTKGNVIIPFGKYDHLSSASNTGLVWAVNYSTVKHQEDGYIWEEQKSNIVAVLQVGKAPAMQTETSGEYIYNTSDPGSDLELPVEQLEKVKDPESAAKAVRYLTKEMTAEQKESSTGIDLATLYAETAAAKAAAKPVTGNTILINAAAVSNLESKAIEASKAVETALADGGITTARYLSKSVILTTEERDISIQIDPDVLDTQVDKIRVEAPSYALTFKLSDLAPDLTQSLTFTARSLDADSIAQPDTVTTSNTGSQGMVSIAMSVFANAAVPAVEIGMAGGKTTNSVTVSLPSDSEDTTYQTVATADGAATASKFNPATTTMDGKINTSGIYLVKSNEKDFTDIANKSSEMQKAIRYLASKGIINGTTTTTFSPDGSINRAEIATLLVKALGKLDSTATASFSDVTKESWFYTAAAASQRHKLINGYEDNTFRGTINISKVEIVAVSSRVLKTEMGYKEPASLAAYLSKYSDAVDSWAQSEVALATRENLVVYRTDGTFSGNKDMTRGDAAIIIYRLFQRIW